MILLYMLIGSVCVGTLASILFVAVVKLFAWKIYWDLAIPFFYLYFAIGAVLGLAAYWIETI